jgi:hypothetical protein
VARISSAIRPRCGELKTLLVIFSGDISYSGLPSEFKVAGEFLNLLIRTLASDLGIVVSGPFIVPGNHDCDFTKQGGIRPVLINALPEDLTTADDDQIREMCKVQDSFFAFEEAYSGIRREGAARLYFTHLAKIDGRTILIHCFNTAWISRLEETQGQIAFPTQLSLETPSERPLIAVSVFHHPYEWFGPTNRRQFRKLIERTSDIVLTGHEHEGDHFDRKSSEGARVAYIEGAAFSAKGTDVGFNLILISPEEQVSQVFRFVEKKSIYEPRSSQTVQFLRNPNIVGDFCENNPDFDLELLRCPVSFSNSTSDGLRIEDIFVYPDLKVRSLLDKKSPDVKSENVLAFVVEKLFVHIAGSAMAGKTTMSRKLYTDLRDEHKYVPILLSGEDIAGRPNDLRKHRDNAFLQQYSEEQLEHFIQQPAAKKALIIDDWHKTRLNRKGKTAFLELARKEFGIVVTFGADQSWFEDVLETAAHSEISEFHHCQIREFGHRLREQMLFKWHALGQEYEIEQSELIRNVARSGALLTGILAKGFFPSFPLFILYTLQIVSAEQTSPRVHGSYGHIYEAFITKRLSLVVQKATDIETYYTYLSLLAFELFTANKKDLSHEDIDRVHKRFVNLYGVPWELDATLSKLEPTGIFGETPGGFGFAQKYCFFLFVAKYFQKALGDNPNDESIRQQLKDMAEMVHDDEYMNILIFYLYLTEDRQLIEFFVKQAESIFADFEPCTLRDDVAFLDDLLQQRKLDLTPTKVTENRSKFADQKDRAEDELEKMHEIRNRTRYDKALNFTVKLDFANHSIQTMGQVLKNFPGAIKADVKNALAKESYLLGLRTITAILDLLRENQELICSLLEQVILVHRAKRDAPTTTQSGKIFAHLAEGSIFGTIKRVSNSVGMEDLSMTYADVRELLGEQNLSARMIDLSIRLDHFSKMPHSDIEDLAGEAKSHLVAYNILVMLVMEHLHLFEVGYKDRQKLTKLVGTRTQNTLISDKKFKIEPT